MYITNPRSSLVLTVSLRRFLTVLLVVSGLGLAGPSPSAAQSLSVTTMRPEGGSPGTTVRIYGSEFYPLGNNTVEFGTATATVDSVRADSTVLYVQVPSGPTGTVDVTVTTPDSSVTAADRFAVVTGGSGRLEAVGAGVEGVTSGSSGEVGTASDWGDYDGDGDLDLVVLGDTTGFDQSLTRIYRNDGSGDFTVVGAGLTDLRGGAVAWGDYDNDGDLDLVTVGRDNGDNEVANIYRNDGGGTFTAIGAGLDHGAFGSVDWGDFDGDGDLDLVVIGDNSSFARSAKIYRNDGGGSFNAINAGLTDVNSSSAEWGDYDGDGDLDLVVTGLRTTPNTFVYRNDGSETFTDIQAGLTGVETGTSNWVDYDNDGDLDLFVTGQDSNDNPTTTLYRNDGSDTFNPVGTNLPPFTRSASEWGDYDGDGDPDLVVSGDTTANNDSLATRIYRNDGGGSFTELTTEMQGLHEGSVSLGDHDGNGELDVLVTGENSYREPVATLFKRVSKTPSPRLTGIRPDGGSPGTSVRIYGSAFGATTGDNTVKFGTATATVNSVSSDSTVLDVQVPSGVSGPVEVTVTTPDSTMTAPTPFTVAVGGDATFAVDDTSLTGVTVGSSSWGDYDEDGDLDLVVTGNDGEGTPMTTIYQNDGSGAFNSVGAGLKSIGVGDTDWGDYDGDGDLDLVVTGGDGTSSTCCALTKIYRNDGGGSFASIGAGLTNLKSSSADWGDYDNDGDLDLVLAGTDAETFDRAIIYRYDGAGTFTPIGAGLTGVQDGSVEWGDYDNDQDLDLLITGSATNSTYSTTIYRNDGDGIFTALGAGLTDVNSSSADWGDYDSDGDLDVVVTGFEASTGNRSATIYRNDGGGTFTTIGANLTGVSDGSSDWGDFDADEDLDLLVTGNDGTGESAILYRNEGSDSFTATGAGLTEVANSSSAWGDFDGDGELDLVVTGSDDSGLVYATLHPSLVPDSAPPDPPKSLSAQANPDSVSLDWTASDSADVSAYRVYRNTSPIDSSSGPTASLALDTLLASQTTYTDTAVVLDTTYYYRLTAVDDAGNESGYSSEAQATPAVDNASPAPPTTLSAQTNPDSVSLDWTASDSSDVASYRIYRDTTSFSSKIKGATPTIVAEVSASQTAYVDTAIMVDTTYYYRATAVDGAGNESGFSNEVETTPRITFSVDEPSNLPVTGTAAELTAQIPSGINPTGGTLFYRKTGSKTFKKKRFSVSTGASDVKVSVPDTAVTERGVDYVVRLSEPLSATDTLRVTNPAETPLLNPAHLRVQIKELTADGSFRSKTYRMISIPVTLGDRTVFDVFKNYYGAYDPTAWRLFRWNPVDSTYQEGPQIDTLQGSGRALWLITDAGDSLSVSSGTSVPGGDSLSLSLVPGWNQVASPFAFPVAWSEVRGSTLVREPVSYDGTQPAGQRYQFNQSFLRPWRGSFVFNPKDTAVTVQVPPTAAEPSGSSTGKERTLAKAEPQGYRLQVIAAMQEADPQLRDHQTWMGFRADAEPGLGPEDRPKPPGIGPHLRVAISGEEGPGLARSLKPIPEGGGGQSVEERGAAWDLRISAWRETHFQTHRTVTVQLSEKGSRPKGFERWVLDTDRGKRLPVTHGNVKIKMAEGEAPRRLRVIVGTEAFAREASEDISLSVSETKLGVNAPNPFSEATRITYQLAEAEEVRLRVYDVLGRHVETLVDGRKEAGVHNVTLRAQDLASGMYFCRMKAGDYMGTLKLTVVR